MRDSDLLPEVVKYGCVSTDINPMGMRFNYMVADAPNEVGKRVSEVNSQNLCGFEPHSEYKRKVN